MKILHVVGDSKFGGGSVIISSLAQSQVDEGHEVDILTTDLEFQEHLTNLKINFESLDCIWRPYNPIKDLIGLLKLTKFLASSNYDVIHTHTTKAGFVGRIASKLASIKYTFHTVHGFAFSEHSTKVKIKIFSSIEKALVFFSDKIFFVSAYHLSWAKKLNILTSKNHQKGVSIPNGIFHPSINQGYMSKINENINSQIKVIFIGRIVREKGVFDLLVAFQEILKEIPSFDATLTFIGDGPDLNTLKEESGKCGYIQFTGFVTNPHDYLYCADIFVLPSYREGLSISALEAQALGIPSLLSNVGGNLEISNNSTCALIYDLSNPSSLKKNLLHLMMSEELRAEFSINSKDNFSNHYTLDKMSSEYQSEYNKTFESAQNEM